MGSLRNTIGIALIAGSSLLTPWVAQAQTMTKQEICESFKRCAHNGCKFLADYVPWFEMFFEQVSLTSEEKSSIDKKFCVITELDYIANDRLVASIMQDKSLTLSQKKSLVLHFFLKSPIDPSLEQYRKKYEQVLMDNYVWTMDNDASITKYIRETLAKAKKTQAIFEEIEKLEELLQMLESE